MYIEEEIDYKKGQNTKLIGYKSSFFTYSFKCVLKV